MHTISQKTFRKRWLKILPLPAALAAAVAFGGPFTPAQEQKERLPLPDSQAGPAAESGDGIFIDGEFIPFNADERSGEEADPDLVDINLQEQPIETFLQIVGEITSKSFILDPQVTGTVKVISSAPIHKSKLEDFFNSVLEVNKLAALKVGENLYKVVPYDSAKSKNRRVLSAEELEDLPVNDEIATAIITLEHAAVEDVLPLIQPLAPENTNMVSIPGGKRIVITATLAALHQILTVVKAVDLEKEQERVYVHYLENAQATIVAAHLNGLYSGNARAAAAASPGAPNPAAGDPAAGGRPGAQPALPSGGQTSDVGGGVVGPVTVVADDGTNALMVKTLPSNYATIEKAIRSLDIVPRQVLIEVAIIEIKPARIAELGWAWDAAKGHITLDLNTGVPKPDRSANPGPTGLFGSYGPLGNYSTNAFLKSLEQQSLLEVLATPTIIASNNQQANFHVGKEVPYTTQTSRGTGNDTIATFEYLPVGTKLKVTPRINQNDFVTMHIEQEVSQDTTTATVGVDAPTILTRNAVTTVTVADHSTLILGGLLEQSKNESRRSIPVLDSIPGIGKLFRKKDTTVEKSELLLFITPHILKDFKDAENLTRHYVLGSPHMNAIHSENRLPENLERFFKEREAEEEKARSRIEKTAPSTPRQTAPVAETEADRMIRRFRERSQTGNGQEKDTGARPAIGPAAGPAIAGSAEAPGFQPNAFPYFYYQAPGLSGARVFEIIGDRISMRQEDTAVRAAFFRKLPGTGKIRLAAQRVEGNARIAILEQPTGENGGRIRVEVEPMEENKPVSFILFVYDASIASPADLVFESPNLDKIKIWEIPPAK